MRRIVFFSFLLGITHISNGQTNSLPTTGNVGIGTTLPATDLHVVGNMTLEGGYVGNAAIYTGTGTQELNRFLLLLNSTQQSSASGLKAGGVLVSDLYSFANPGKNDLVVKGGVSIGTASVPSGFKLSVAGKMIATEMKIQQIANWPDYVFDSSYKLTPLIEVEKYIRKNKHLPEFPTAEEVGQNGIELGASQALLLRKIEELTLYIIEQHKKVEQLTGEVNQLKMKESKGN
ncbi:MAG TPA: hypothetical protein PKE30_21480, partial [Niabella sp.]|nr:hypothetical protein [Niabella sp.]